jgi:hypothetical protein
VQAMLFEEEDDKRDSEGETQTAANVGHISLRLTSGGFDLGITAEDLIKAAPITDESLSNYSITLIDNSSMQSPTRERKLQSHDEDDESCTEDPMQAMLFEKEDEERDSEGETQTAASVGHIFLRLAAGGFHLGITSDDNLIKKAPARDETRDGTMERTANF